MALSRQLFFTFLLLFLTSSNAVYAGQDEGRFNPGKRRLVEVEEAGVLARRGEALPLPEQDSTSRAEPLLSPRAGLGSEAEEPQAVMAGAGATEYTTVTITVHLTQIRTMQPPGTITDPPVVPLARRQDDEAAARQASESARREVESVSRSAADALRQASETMRQASESADRAVREASQSVSQASREASQAVSSAMSSADRAASEARSSASSAVADNASGLDRSMSSAMASISASISSAVMQAQASVDVVRADADTRINQANSSALSSTQVALAIVGGVVGSSLLSIAIFWVVLRQKRKHARSSERQRSRDLGYARESSGGAAYKSTVDTKSYANNNNNNTAASWYGNTKETTEGLDRSASNASNASSLYSTSSSGGVGYATSSMGAERKYSRGMQGGVGIKPVAARMAKVEEKESESPAVTQPLPTLQNWLQAGTVSPFGTLRRSLVKARDDDRRSPGWPFEKK